jgi:anthranilate synthase component 2
MCPNTVKPLVLIDNYDSFTYNIYRYLKGFTGNVVVVKNDDPHLSGLQGNDVLGFVLSPGPGSPNESGFSIEILKRFHREKPFLGICLGHQVIASFFGGEIVRLPEPLHGKIRTITNNGEGLFKGLPSSIDVGLYHSLIVERKSFPACLDVTAETADGLIMGFEHRIYPLTGIQFHPESIMTEYGHKMIGNWLRKTLCI